MATVKKQGRGYKITVSNGFDGAGNRIRQHTTWVPRPGMTPLQIEKELNRQVVLFEEEVKTGAASVDGSMRFSVFAEKFLKEYAELNLGPHTVFRYRQQLERISLGIGHIKMKELRPMHITKLFANLQEAGLRGDVYATPRIDIRAWCREHKMSFTQLATQAGISGKCVQKCLKRARIAKENALRIAAVMGTAPDQIFSFEQDMTPLSPATIISYFNTLSSALNCAVNWKIIKENPATGVKLPSNTGKRAPYFDEPEARRLLECLSTEDIQWRALLTFDLLSGLRRAELLGLRWCDVDLDDQLLHVRQTWNYQAGKGCYIGKPKTPDSQRIVKISRTAVLLLLEVQRWQNERRQSLGDAWVETDGRVFTYNDGRPIFPDMVTHWFKKFIRKNGLPESAHVHSLRHTYASLQIADGTPLVVVSSNLGHARTSTTTDIYAHVISEAAAKAAAISDRFADLVVDAGTKVAPKASQDDKAG